MTLKRLFFGMEMQAPWPSEWPEGRRIQEPHLTLAFLGAREPSDVEKVVRPPFHVAPCGWFDRLLALPEAHPRVIAWHASWWERSLPDFALLLTNWLRERALFSEKRPWLSHVTLCRSPFLIHQWQKAFEILPCYAGSFNLYESLGNSLYKPLWTHPLLPPFEEIPHTADLAFRIRAESLPQLYIHALTALAFYDPALLLHRLENPALESLEEIIILLNKILSVTDREQGSPFKAVSFHGSIQHLGPLLEWEMIIDV